VRVGVAKTQHPALVLSLPVQATRQHAPVLQQPREQLPKRIAWTLLHRHLQQHSPGIMPWVLVPLDQQAVEYVRRCCCKDGLRTQQQQAPS
jgi:hypothetical protein